MDAKELVREVSKDHMARLLSDLFLLQVKAHWAHLQTGSFAAHMALNGLYEVLPGLLDRFVECYQGTSPVIQGYSIKGNDTDPVRVYMDYCLGSVDSLRKIVKEGSLLQILDDISELIRSTAYKLDKLK